MGLFQTGILRTTVGIQVPDYIRYPEGKPKGDPAPAPPVPWWPRLHGPSPVAPPPVAPPYGRPSTSPTPFGLGVLALLGLVALGVAAKRAQDAGAW